MKKSRFSPEQISRILKEHDQGKSSEELCRIHGISHPTFYKWLQNMEGWSQRCKGFCKSPKTPTV